MNVNAVSDGGVSIENSVTTEGRHTDHGQRENSSQNQVNPGVFGIVNDKKKIPPMNPTPLYATLFSLHPASCFECL